MILVFYFFFLLPGLYMVDQQLSSNVGIMNPALNFVFHSAVCRER